MPLFLLALVAVRGVPALLHGRLLPRRQQIAAALSGERVAHAMPTPATPVLGSEDRALCLPATGTK
ncbi:MAG: hypothetical protein M3076_18345 [Actinomycetota bacterium]|nr:hypothetical protein [Actinomycetota bacterium]